MGGGLTAAEPMKDRIIHPTLHFNHSEEIKLPKEGHAVIKFRRVRTGSDDSDPEDPRFSHEIEIHGIELKDAPDEEKAEEKLKMGLRKALNKEKK